jgi:predicted nuclease with TOPRIM domain
MRQQLEERLNKLKAEFESGQKMLADFDARASSLRETLLRIGGAIQVLEEELKEAGETVSEDNQA